MNCNTPNTMKDMSSAMQIPPPFEGGGQGVGEASRGIRGASIGGNSTHPPAPSLRGRGSKSCRRGNARRGNSLILVTALLVLLVIVASAYISRVQGGRITGTSTQYLNQREDIAKSVADDIAMQISEHLFVRPLDFNAANPLNANTPRLPIPPNAVRFQPDVNDLANLIRINLPPYEVKPYTNPPDAAGATTYPQGDGAPTGQNLEALLGVGEGNPLGGPGFGDTRWLRSTEPMRWQVPGTDNTLGTPDDAPIYGQWRHMSNIAHANNGWRICYDISNVDAAILTDLSIPVEQFLAVRPSGAGANSAINTGTGFQLPRLPDNFIGRVTGWFTNYANVYADPNLMLPNFLHLADLDGDGVKFNDPRGDLPSQEFVRGTARWAVSTALTDADNDGFTDSFWFLAPSSIDRGVRTVVGMSVVDNGGLGNINVATSFQPIDGGFFPNDGRTRGTTPADLALIGEMRLITAAQALNPGLNNWNLGLFDFPGNWARFPNTNFFSRLTSGTSQRYWQQHIAGNGLPVQLPSNRPNQADRLAWWRGVGVAGPYTPWPGSGFAPYGADDELELRMFAGNNNAWSYSRLEQTFQLDTTSSGSNSYGRYILRGEIDREESAEFLDKLHNRELVGNMRTKVTTYSATRTETMPPWLWPDNWPNLSPIYREKVDLRAPLGNFFRDNIVNNDDRLYLYEVLKRALISEATQESYLGSTANATQFVLEDADRMCGMLAANIKGYLDEDYLAPLTELIDVENDNPYGVNGEIYAYGLERQPFLVEAMVGHVYVGDEAQSNHPDAGNGGAITAGDLVATRDGDQSTFVVVQIANPFNEAILLNDPREHYELEVFGQVFDFRNLAGGVNPVPPSLPPATYGNPVTMTIVAIDSGGISNPPGTAYRDSVLNWLGIDSSNPYVILVDLEGFGSPFSTNRTPYDDGLTAPGVVQGRDDAVQLVRVVADPFNAGTFTRVIIDRFDDPGNPVFGPSTAAGTVAFARATSRLDLSGPTASLASEPGDGVPWPGVENITARNANATHYIQWSHVTRAWGIRPELSQRSPRFIFANHMTTTGENAFFFNVATTDIGGHDSTGQDDWTPMFDHNMLANGYPEKSFDGAQSAGLELEFPLQMNWKDGDIEQLGELFNVFTHSHLLLYVPGPAYSRTLKTFSEWMQVNLKSAPGNKVRVGRLDPFRAGSVITSKDPSGGFSATPPPQAPSMPAAFRVLDAFTLDGRGFNTPTSQSPPYPAGYLEPRLANGFLGKAIHGLININTAPVEVLRMLPHMTRIMHAGNIPLPGGVAPAEMPRVAIPEAIVQARESYNGDVLATGPPYRNGVYNGPDYKGRKKYGFENIGELFQVSVDAQNQITEHNQIQVRPEAWSIEFAANDPFGVDVNGTDILSAYISTDVVQPTSPDNLEGDNVAADAEEYNLLFSGLSNLVTTRSDTFTVYFRVRSFRQNPTTGVWDATDPENIIDDSRYVMMVDRSNVNRPGDKPRILYLEKLPN